MREIFDMFKYYEFEIDVLQGNGKNEYGEDIASFNRVNVKGYFLDNSFELDKEETLDSYDFVAFIEPIYLKPGSIVKKIKSQYLNEDVNYVIKDIKKIHNFNGDVEYLEIKGVKQG